MPERDVDDGVQSVLLVAARRLCEVPAEKERAFLFGVARRVALDLRRSARRRPVTGDEPLLDLEDGAPLPDERIDRARDRACIEGAIEALDEDLRAVFVMARLEGRTLTEIAAELELPRGTAASRLRRASEAFDASLSRRRAQQEGARASAFALTRPPGRLEPRRAGPLLGFAIRWLEHARACLSAAAACGATVLLAPAPVEPAPSPLAARATSPERLSVTHTDVGRRPADGGATVQEEPATASTIPSPRAPVATPTSPRSSIAAKPLASASAPPLTTGETAREPPTADALLAELRSLESVRAALLAGDRLRASSMLERHRAAFPRPALGPEAAALARDLRPASAPGGGPGLRAK